MSVAAFHQHCEMHSVCSTKRCSSKNPRVLFPSGTPRTVCTLVLSLLVKVHLCWVRDTEGTASWFLCYQITLAHLAFICFSSLQTGSVPELKLSQPTPSPQMHFFKWKGVSFPPVLLLHGFQVWNSVHLFTHLACAGAWKHTQGLISAAILKHKQSFRLHSTFRLDQLAEEELQLGDGLSTRSTSHSVLHVLIKTFHFKGLVFLKRGAVPARPDAHRFA